MGAAMQAGKAIIELENPPISFGKIEIEWRADGSGHAYFFRDDFGYDFGSDHTFTDFWDRQFIVKIPYKTFKSVDGKLVDAWNNEVSIYQVRPVMLGFTFYRG
jgi:hypothetical protein